MNPKKIGFIGCNNMSGAILHGALEGRALSKENVYVYDINPVVIERMTSLGVNVVANNHELCQKSDLIVLGTKPQHLEGALLECGNALDGKAVVSIAAGITIERIDAMIVGKARILRIMPNTPSMVNAGANVFCLETDLKEDEKETVVAIFNAIGMVEWVPERLINAISGMSGGGPAYIAMFIEAMADAGVKNGIPREMAYRLSAQTCFGTAKMILETKMHPGMMKDMVTSPGGTTIEGVEALEKGGMRYAVMDCITRATKKASKL
ncbi:MAG: pyrroline-5-carboxylate reductase [Lachnospiraceae bacterium]|nr:pyrroline-5-carboxylate reductase [Lachnospiraceae bacterium]